MGNYSVASKMIIEAIEKAAEPLTDDQKSVLHGAISGLLMSIGAIGLDQCLKNIEK